MRKLVAVLVAALFTSVTGLAYAADQATPSDQTQPQKPAQKKKKPAKKPAQPSSSAVEAGGQTTGQAGRGAPAANTGAAAVTEGGTQPGRGTPTGTAAPGGAVQAVPPKGPGRGDNQ
jgi:hypothetical protein